MPVLTRRLFGGIDHSGNFLFAEAPIKFKQINFLELWRKSFRGFHDMNSDFPQHLYTGELTFVACGCSGRK